VLPLSAAELRIFFKAKTTRPALPWVGCDQPMVSVASDTEIRRSAHYPTIRATMELARALTSRPHQLVTTCAAGSGAEDLSAYLTGMHP
jgi:hypothetical protein